jgi:hypothetical protein
VTFLTPSVVGKSQIAVIVNRQKPARSGHPADKNSAKGGVIDQRDEAHGSATVGTFERIDFVTFFNQVRPIHSSL